MMLSSQTAAQQKEGEHNGNYLAIFKLQNPFIQEQLYTGKSVHVDTATPGKNDPSIPEVLHFKGCMYKSALRSPVWFKILIQSHTGPTAENLENLRYCKFMGDL